MTKNVYCSFCGKPAETVEFIIAGPTVFICDECVDWACGCIAERRAGLPAKTAPSPPVLIPKGRLRDKHVQIYFIHCKATNAIKIGHGQNARTRFSQIQMGCAEKLTLLGSFWGVRADEVTIHEKFSDRRLSGEWFKDTPELRKFIAEVVK